MMLSLPRTQKASHKKIFMLQALENNYQTASWSISKLKCPELMKSTLNIYLKILRLKYLKDVVSQWSNTDISLGMNYFLQVDN